MPPSSFRPAEQEFFERYITRWSKLKQRPVAGQTHSEQLRQKTELIREVTKAFLIEFPERDPSATDRPALTFTEADLAKLPQRARQWLTNNTRPVGGQEIQEKQKTRGHTHARNLATQRYSQEINHMAIALREETPEMKQLTSFNKATTLFLERLENDPQAYQKLYDDAIGIRESAEKDFSEHSPEVLEKISLGNSLRKSESMAVLFLFTYAAFGLPSEPTLKTYTVSTTSVEGITKSSAHKNMRKEYLEWVSQALGASASGQVETAIRMIYPNMKRAFRPRFPVILNTKSVPTHTLRSWLRTFFNYQFAWQGGGRSVNWKQVSKDTRFHYIAASCFPEGINALKSPDEMTRSEQELWYHWLISGQEGRLAPQQEFQFSVIDQHAGCNPLIYSEPIISCPKDCQLVWTPEEKMYALRLQKETEEGHSKQGWKELPLARLRLVFEPFTASMRTLISMGCLEEYQTGPLTTAAFDLERYGPIH
ncbi:hypothetical protein V565_269020, partial [Rhizoctonia solani 123E]